MMMRSKGKGKLPPLRDRQRKSSPDVKVPKALGPFGYIMKDTLRNRARTLLATSLPTPPKPKIPTVV